MLRVFPIGTAGLPDAGPVNGTPLSACAPQRADKQKRGGRLHLICILSPCSIDLDNRHYGH